MKHHSTLSLSDVQRGQCLTEKELKDLDIAPTNIDCFQFSHFLLYAKGDKRIIVQPLPHNQYKIIRTYDYVEANSSIWIG
jgi:hypothetical protein